MVDVVIGRFGRRLRQPLCWLGRLNRDLRRLSVHDLFVQLRGRTVPGRVGVLKVVVAELLSRLDRALGCRLYIAMLT